MNVFTALSSMMAYYRSERREGEKGERECSVNKMNLTVVLKTGSHWKLTPTHHLEVPVLLSV